METINSNGDVCLNQYCSGHFPEKFQQCAFIAAPFSEQYYSIKLNILTNMSMSSKIFSIYYCWVFLNSLFL
jgi:hypothetical protein